MNKYLSFDTLPEYINSSFRYFYPDEKHITRTINEDVLLMVFSGILRFSENNVPVEVSAGQYYIQKANLFQEGVAPSSSPKYYYIHFNGDFTDPTPGIAIKGTFSFNDTKELLFKLDSLIKSKTKTRLEITSVFYEILQKLKETNTIEEKEASLAKTIENILAEKYSEPLSLSLLEEKLNYSKDYIIRSFKKSYGITPHQYISELRMNHARQLLLSTNRTVQLIAEECGYNDLSAFYRLFNKLHDCSPKEWKAKSVL
ncbi:MAG: hypothetical protein A2Y17_06700 [Clostridiales bacterium GWF2_38_85]|nr:MAG: hypothetical protein A2Y17_06700 [Clostridiales bacterium GWF2_38_85]